MGHFLALLRLQASPPEPKSGSYCTIAFNQAVSCWLCTIAETVGLSPAATPGAPFIPVGKDAMTPWIFFSSQPLFYHKSHYVTRFCGRFVVQTPPKKGSVKSVFFHIVSKILRHRLFTCKKSASSLPAVKDACLFLTYAGEILLLPLPTVLDTYFRFLTTPGVRRGKNAFSLPHIGVITLSSTGSRVAITGGTLFHGQGNRQSRHHHPEPHKIFYSPSYKYYQLDT